MATNVLFRKGTSARFATLEKDPNTLYFLTDTHEIYFGDRRYGFGDNADIAVNVIGSGDIVKSVAWDSDETQLEFTLGNASDVESIQTIIDSIQSDIDGLSEEVSQVSSAISGLSGAMHYIGISSTEVTDGGRELPTIQDEEISADKLNPGDVVLYSVDETNKYKEFIWALDPRGSGYWSELGYTAIDGAIPEGYIEEYMLSDALQEKLNNAIIDTITPEDVNTIFSATT